MPQQSETHLAEEADDLNHAVEDVQDIEDVLFLIDLQS